MHEILSPRMQDGKETDLCPEVLRVGGDLHQSFRCGPKHQRIENPFVVQEQGSQDMRDCEDQVHIRHRKEFPLTGGQPPFSGIVQTLRAMPVPAAVVREGDGLTASGTLIQVPTECRCPATFDCGEHLQVLMCQPGSMFTDEVPACRTNDIRHLDGWPGHGFRYLRVRPTCVRSRTASPSSGLAQAVI